jgi:hypothetical protein
MRLLLSFCLSVLFTSGAVAQLISFPVKGKFYISVDDTAHVYVNNRLLYKAAIGESSSSETLLEPGDRIVVKLFNKMGPRKFAMIFVSTYQKTIVSFRNQMCKIIPDAEKTDITEKEYRDLKQFANQDHHGEMVRRFGFKNNAEWLWGVGNPCALGCIIQRDFFKAMPQ